MSTLEPNHYLKSKPIKMKFYSLLLFLSVLLFNACNPKAPDATVVVNSKESMRAKKGETVWIVTNKVKPESKNAFESFMKDIFLNTLANSTKDSTKLLYSKTRYLTPKKQNRDSSWTYVFIMDPWVEGGNYSELDLFKEKFPVAKAMEYDSMYMSYMKEQPTVTQLIQTEH
jgi:hypothetical protein